MNKNGTDELFQTERCRDFDDFITRSKKLLDSKHAWVFRGQKKEADFKNRQWLLRSSYERACEQFGVETSIRVELEQQMIREFQRRLHHYTKDIPDMTLNDEWLSLMQHYGAPTRLLDFTYSPYVASYFAFEFSEPNTSVAVWAVDANWCTEQLRRSNQDLAHHYREYGDNREGHHFNAIFMGELPHKLVLSVNPFRLNERLAYQKGVFLCPGDVTVGFMDNLLSYKGKQGFKESIVQYVIPACDRNRALVEMERMNINRTTLFPGLDGFAQSLSVKIITQFLPQQGLVDG